jgi:hypothetical protein
MAVPYCPDQADDPQSIILGFDRRPGITINEFAATNQAKTNQAETNQQEPTSGS